MRKMRLAAAFAVAMAVTAPQASLAQQQPGPPMIQGTVLSVSAEGKTTGRPDMATINLGVQTDGQTAQAALQANSQRMTALVAALRHAGVAERDIQTSNVSVNPTYEYRQNEPPRLTGYQANNSVVAKVRAIDTTGRVIDAAVSAGGNTVNGVNFSYQNPDAQLDAARRNAIQEARRRAELYAQALDMHVVRVISVNEGGGYTPPMPMPMMARAEAAPAPPPPVEAGEVETTASVSVVFELR